MVNLYTTGVAALFAYTSLMAHPADSRRIILQAPEPEPTCGGVVENGTFY